MQASTASRRDGDRGPRLEEYAAAVRRCLGAEGPALAVRDAVDSTNRLARRVAAHYLEAGQSPPQTLVLALEQTAGRGRRGRPWSSPRGLGVYATLIVGLEGPACPTTLPLLVAVGLCRGLDPLLPDACRIKWPNDLLVDGRKIGGVLIETVARGGRIAALIGFGVNHSQPAAALPGAAATSIALEGADPRPLAELTSALTAAVRRELRRMDDPEYALAAYRSRSLHRAGDRLRYRGAGGLVEGTFRGFDSRGFLRLESPAGELLVVGGEVTPC